ncbi:hypothetical protein [Corynebacterium sputi]|uniref:hypothetical protein n=1 Tax=Corynebacterium sputi TaxID=489915 RepID=UPI0004241ED2|nr:hypothetical protein [Corynebacterium sputi]
MNARRSITALVVAGCTALSLAACGDEGEEEVTTSETTTTEEVETLPTAADLNAVLERATDPNLPVEEKMNTVEDGEEAAEFFEIMTQSKEETGANVIILDPVLEGYAPDTVRVPARFEQPDQEPQEIPEIDFIKIDGDWRLSKTWACMLVEQVSPENIPPMCAEEPVPAPEGEVIEEEIAPAPEGELPPPEEAPAEEMPAEPAPA